MIMNRFGGPYSPIFWSLILCNIIVPQTIWIKKVRTSPVLLFIVAMFVNVGMWIERFVIVVTSLHRDFLPSSWDMYSGTIWDWGLYLGTIGLFFLLLLVFIRVMPMISIFEMRTLVPHGASSLPPETGVEGDTAMREGEQASDKDPKGKPNGSGWG